MLVLGFACVAALALVHVFIARMRFLATVPRSGWLSLAGGAAVAYVFLHVLPELAANGSVLSRALHETALESEESVYALALVGLVLFYGLERLIRSPKTRHTAGAYQLHLASFALYNGLIGYLVFHRETTGPVNLLLFAAAMGFHFLTTDFALSQDHDVRYERWGRWLLVAALVAGAVLGALTTVPEWTVAFLFALLSGGVLLNVLKEELPAERQSRFGAFLAGAVVYGALLWVI